MASEPAGFTRYTTIDADPGGGVDVEIEIRKSRFLARLRRVDDESAARAVVDERRHAHPTARHHCSAFVLGPGGRTARSSDDGEPSGTAGIPMLSVLQRNDLTDVVAVVTRYFGGIKLGAGGLVRAYGEVVALGVELAGTREVALSQLLAVEVPAANAGHVESQLRGLVLPDGTPVHVTDVAWGENATITVAIPTPSVPDFETALTALSAGQLRASAVGTEWVDQRA